MNELIILTGANGHLGRTISQLLTMAQRKVRGLVLPGENTDLLKEFGVEIVSGDVTNKEDIKVLFEDTADKKIIVIHAAAIIDIVSHVSPMVHSVNVGGTKNMVEAALEYKADKFLYVSSVHAIPEKPGKEKIYETKVFSPDLVEGGYAKTKAEASAYVMEAFQKRGLPAVILHPTGILGPGDSGNNHIITVIKAYMEKRLPASIRAGYNLVDVRDVAEAIITAIEKGGDGETYILGGHHCEVPNILKAVSLIIGNGPRHCPVAPKWLAYLAAIFVEKSAARKKLRPLFTKYAVKTLGSNDNFSHAKASVELGFRPRNIFRTLEDTIAWLGSKEWNEGFQKNA